MKKRLGFVGNSSSSSFIINIKGLTKDDINIIEDYKNNKPNKKGLNFLLKLDPIFHNNIKEVLKGFEEDHWEVIKGNGTYEFSCDMNDFALAEYLIGCGMSIDIFKNLKNGSFAHEGALYFNDDYIIKKLKDK